MLEVVGQHALGKGFLVEDYEADSVGSPSNDLQILLILNGARSTLSSS